MSDSNHNINVSARTIKRETRERKTNGGQKKMDELTTKVIFADQSGHTTLELTKDETVDLINSNKDQWIYRDNQMVPANEIAEADWNDVGTIMIMPGLTGGY